MVSNGTKLKVVQTNNNNISNTSSFGNDALIVNVDGGIYLGNNTNTPTKLTATIDDIANKASFFSFTDIEANNWVEDSRYENYQYCASLSCPGVTENDYAEVVFNVEHASSGNYAPVCESGASIVKIWSAVTDNIIIPTVIVTR